MRSWNLNQGRSRGITLVELMVALALSLLLLLGVGTVFVANKQAFRLQESLARVQENGRFALQAIVRDIRNAGYLGCDSRRKLAVHNTLNGAKWQAALEVPLVGFDADGNSWTPAPDGDGSPTAPVASSTASAKPELASDMIMLNLGIGTGARVIQHNLPSADIKVEPNADIDTGDILLVSDCQFGAIFQATNVQNLSTANTNIEHETGSGTPGNSTKNLVRRFGPQARVIRLASRVYYVSTGTGGEPALFRVDNGGTPEELVEGIEALQFIFGLDNDGDNVIDAYVRASGVGTAWDKVLAVRVQLVARSANDRVLSKDNDYAFNDNVLKGTDRRLRKQFGATVVLRNRLP